MKQRGTDPVILRSLFCVNYQFSWNNSCILSFQCLLLHFYLFSINFRCHGRVISLRNFTVAMHIVNLSCLVSFSSNHLLLEDIIEYQFCIRVMKLSVKFDYILFYYCVIIKLISKWRAMKFWLIKFTALSSKSLKYSLISYSKITRSIYRFNCKISLNSSAKFRNKYQYHLSKNYIFTRIFVHKYSHGYPGKFPPVFRAKN